MISNFMIIYFILKSLRNKICESLAIHKFPVLQNSADFFFGFSANASVEFNFVIAEEPHPSEFLANRDTLFR